MWHARRVTIIFYILSSFTSSAKYFEVYNSNHKWHLIRIRIKKSTKIRLDKFRARLKTITKKWDDLTTFNSWKLKLSTTSGLLGLHLLLFSCVDAIVPIIVTKIFELIYFIKILFNGILKAIDFFNYDFWSTETNYYTIYGFKEIIYYTSSPYPKKYPDKFTSMSDIVSDIEAITKNIEPVAKKLPNL